MTDLGLNFCFGEDCKSAKLQIGRNMVSNQARRGCELLAACCCV